MTTIITRLYPDAHSSDMVVSALNEAGFTATDMDVIAPSDAAATQMEHACVSNSSAQAYGDCLTGSRRLVVVRAGFNPIGAARRAIDIVDATASLDVGIKNEDHYIAKEPDRDQFVKSRVLRNHPLMLSSDLATPGWSASIGLVSPRFGMRMSKTHRPRRSANARGGNNFPFGNKIIRNSKDSVIEGGGHPLSRALGLPLISDRD